MEILWLDYLTYNQKDGAWKLWCRIKDPFWLSQNHEAQIYNEMLILENLGFFPSK